MEVLVLCLKCFTALDVVYTRVMFEFVFCSEVTCAVEPICLLTNF